MEELSIRDSSVESARRAPSITGRKKSEETKPDGLTPGPCVVLAEADPYTWYFFNTQFCPFPSSPRLNSAHKYSHFKTRYESCRDG